MRPAKKTHLSSVNLSEAMFSRLSALFAVTVVSGLVSGVRADMVTLELENPSLELEAGSISDPLTVRIVNDTAVSLSEDFLTGWELELMILPDAGASGSLQFNSPTSGSSLAEPSGYIFGSVSNFGIGVTNSGTTLNAFDLDFPFSGGASIPADPGASLLTLDFEAAPASSGVFGIYAVDGPAHSSWVDANEPNQQRRAFVNVPDGSGPVRIGEVTIVPDTSAFPWHNSIEGLDVTNDGNIFPDDVLAIVNEINANGSRDLPVPPVSPFVPPPFLDTFADNFLEPFDALLIVNFLNSQQATPGPIPATGPVSVPEPSTLVLLVVGLLGIGCLTRRKRRP